jgi:hypothetical protein
MATATWRPLGLIEVPHSTAVYKGCQLSRSLKAPIPTPGFTIRMVKQIRNGTTTYYYADPACHCVHVGNQAAFASFRAMQNTVFEMNQVQVNPGIGMGAFNDLDSWQPL